MTRGAGSTDVEHSAGVDGVFRIRDLGSLCIDIAGTSTAVSGKLERILSTLVISANHRVSVDSLIDAVWGESASAQAAGTLESHIFRLRKMLEPNRRRGQPPTFLVNDAGGYRLIVNPDNVDSLRFAQLVDYGERLLRSREIDRARRRCESALQLWRGRPFDAVADEEWAAPAVARLEELYAQVQQHWAEALLLAGHADRVVPVLHQFTAATPFREQLWAQLMRGLYQLGRTEQALATYQRVRVLLLDGLGMEPGDELRSLHQRMLDRDPTLARPVPAAAEVTTRSDDAPTTSGSRPPLNLPVRLSPLIGRAAELTRLPGLLTRCPVLTIVGSAGCGKTRLAIETARAAAADFADGIWFVDLTAVDDPAAVPMAVVSTLQIAPAAVGGVTATLRNYLRDRQILLVIDNCEHLLPAVRALLEELLAEDADFRVLATSREPLGIDGETLWTLAPLATAPGGSDPDAASAAGLSDAAQLFVARAESNDPMFEVDEDRAADIERICAALDGIPLAIELAAGRIRSASVPEIRRQVSAEPLELAHPGHSRVEHHQTVERSIEWSVQLLSAAERRVHERLCVLSGAFTTDAAVAVAGWDPIPPSAVANLLAQLAHRSLLTVVAPERDGRPTRFRQLATVRAHATREAQRTGQIADATLRRGEFITRLVAARPPFDADDNGWYDRVDDDHDTLTAVLQHTLHDQPDPLGVRIVGQLVSYWFYRARVSEAVQWLPAALRQTTAPAEDLILAELTGAYVEAMQDRTDLSLALVRSALGRPRANVDRRSLAYGLVSAAWIAWVRGDTALEFVDVEVRQLAGDDPIIGMYADVLAAKTALATDGPAAVGPRATQLTGRADGLGNTMAAWLATWIAVLCALLSGDAAGGRACLRRVNEYYRRLGGGPAANAVEFDADFAALAGDLLEAARLFGQASRMAFRAGMPWPLSPASQVPLTQVRQHLPAEQFESAWREGEAAGA